MRTGSPAPGPAAPRRTGRRGARQVSDSGKTSSAEPNSPFTASSLLGGEACPRFQTRPAKPQLGPGSKLRRQGCVLDQPRIGPRRGAAAGTHLSRQGGTKDRDVLHRPPPPHKGPLPGGPGPGSTCTRWGGGGGEGASPPSLPSPPLPPTPGGQKAEKKKKLKCRRVKNLTRSPPGIFYFIFYFI